MYLNFFILCKLQPSLNKLNETKVLEFSRFYTLAQNSNRMIIKQSQTVRFCMICMEIYDAIFRQKNKKK